MEAIKRAECWIWEYGKFVVLLMGFGLAIPLGYVIIMRYLEENYFWMVVGPIIFINLLVQTVQQSGFRVRFYFKE
jgi:hypothetical protein